MKDRDLITQTLARVYNQRDTPIPDDVIESWHPYADALLAAIGDRLLPDMPDGWWWLDVTATSSHIESVIHCDPIPGGEKLRGTGPTIPAAIRNALEDEE